MNAFLLRVSKDQTKLRLTRESDFVICEGGAWCFSSNIVDKSYSLYWYIGTDQVNIRKKKIKRAYKEYVEDGVSKVS